MSAVSDRTQRRIAQNVKHIIMVESLINVNVRQRGEGVDGR